MDVYNLWIIINKSIYPVVIGIDSSENTHIDGDFFNIRCNKNVFYAIGSKSYLYQQNYDARYVFDVHKWNENDIIQFVLDI